MKNFKVGYNGVNMKYEAIENNKVFFSADNLDWLEFQLKGYYLKLPTLSKHVILFDNTLLLKKDTNISNFKYAFNAKFEVIGIKS